MTPILFSVGACNFDDGNICDWTQSTADRLNFKFDSKDVYNSYKTGPPHEHTSGGDLIPDKDCKTSSKGLLIVSFDFTKNLMEFIALL